MQGEALMISNHCVADDIHTKGVMIYNGEPLIFYFRSAKIKKPPPIWKRKQLYHPFTYPPICAQDYGRAPSLITWLYQLHFVAVDTRFHKRDSEVIFGHRFDESPPFGWYTLDKMPRQSRLAHTPYRAFTYPDSLCLFCAATVFVTVFRFFTHRFYYKYFKKSILLLN